MLVQGVQLCGGSRGSRLERVCGTPQPRVRFVQWPCSVGPERDPGRRAHVESAGRPARDRVTAAVLPDTRPCCSGRSAAALGPGRLSSVGGLFQNSHGNLAAGLGHGVPASGRGEVPTGHREARAGSSPPAPALGGSPTHPGQGVMGAGALLRASEGLRGTASGAAGGRWAGTAVFSGRHPAGRVRWGEHPLCRHLRLLGGRLSTLLCSPIARWVGGRGAQCPQRPWANRPGLGSRIHRARGLPLARA